MEISTNNVHANIFSNMEGGSARDMKTGRVIYLSMSRRKGQKLAQLWADAGDDFAAMWKAAISVGCGITAKSN